MGVAIQTSTHASISREANFPDVLPLDCRPRCPLGLLQGGTLGNLAVPTAGRRQYLTKSIFQPS